MQKVLAQAGLGSRRACEELISQGRVTINGEVAKELGVKVDPSHATIHVDGQKVKLERHVYYAVHKPKGYVASNNDPAGKPLVVDLLSEVPQRVYTVGRLDEQSTGLILLTNDGDLANKLAHPKYGVEKIYRVVVAGLPQREVLDQLTKGIWLAEGKVRAKRVRIVGQKGQASVLEMVLAEGKNREIRRMLAKLGHKVMSLTRIAVGPVGLKGLGVGEVRPLSARELDLLRQVAAGIAVPSPKFPDRRPRVSRPGTESNSNTEHDEATPTPEPRRNAPGFGPGRPAPGGREGSQQGGRPPQRPQFNGEQGRPPFRPGGRPDQGPRPPFRSAEGQGGQGRPQFRPGGRPDQGQRPPFRSAEGQGGQGRPPFRPGGRPDQGQRPPFRSAEGQGGQGDRPRFNADQGPRPPYRPAGGPGEGQGPRPTHNAEQGRPPYRPEGRPDQGQRPRFNADQGPRPPYRPAGGSSQGPRPRPQGQDEGQGSRPPQGGPRIYQGNNGGGPRSSQGNDRAPQGRRPGGPGAVHRSSRPAPPAGSRPIVHSSEDGPSTRRIIGFGPETGGGGAPSGPSGPGYSGPPGPRLKRPGPKRPPRTAIGLKRPQKPGASDE